MFSANENLQLRQHKRRVVQYVEETMPEEVLDLGVNVMVMQVSCKAPGCVPLETAIVIVFPNADQELLPGLKESQGGSYKTKVLKPMSAVTKEDVLESLPLVFMGGQRSVEKLCLQARDVMLGQITQLFGDEDVEGRRLMAQYLQKSLQDYMDRGCTPPEWGEAFTPLPSSKTKDALPLQVETKNETASSSTFLKGNKNIVIQRVFDNDDNDDRGSGKNHSGNTSRNGTTGDSKSETVTRPTSMSSSSTSNLVDSVTRRRLQQTAERELNLLSSLDGGSNDPLSRLAQREHAPGMRQPGCPCCDPDNPQNIVDQFLQF